MKFLIWKIICLKEYKIKILNLYSGIGGNRKLWGNDNYICSVEKNIDILNIYKDIFKNDTIVNDDAHSFLLKNFYNFDFIWSSPPCQSHSSFRHNICVRFRGTSPVYPDMALYQEILFLKHNFNGFWIVENVKPFYEPLIKPSFVLGRHYFWSNITAEFIDFENDNIRKNQIKDFEKMYGYDLSKYKIKNKRQVLRNCVNPKIGLYILNEVRKYYENK